MYLWWSYVYRKMKANKNMGVVDSRADMPSLSLARAEAMLLELAGLCSDPRFLRKLGGVYWG